MSSWFRDRFSYTGRATLEFERPHGSVSGEGTVEVDERGGFTVGFSVDDYEYLEPDMPDEGYVLERLLTGNPTMRDDEGRSTGISIAPHNVCTSFRLITQEGVLQAVGSIKYQIGNDDSGNWSVGVFPFRLRYDVHGKEDAAYWAMPLSNFVAGFLQEPSPAARVNPLLVSKGGYSIIEFGSHGGQACTHRRLNDDDIGRITDTYHAWRGEEEAIDRRGEYEDTPGFCASVGLEDIRKHGHVLTPGRYVGAEAAEEDTEPFEEKMRRLTAQWRDQQAEARRLDTAIEANLKALGYTVNE